MTSTRPAQDRHRERAARLSTLRVPGDRGTTIDGLAKDARAKLWAGRPGAGTTAGGGVVVLRSGLILRNGHPTSPLLDAAAPRSAAVQFLLVALFAAQCRKPANAAGAPTQVPLRDPVDPASSSWRYLVALATADAPRRATASRTPTENRVAQLRAALKRLHACGRVELARPQGRGRFEGFRLLHESTYRPQEAVYYRVPSSAEPVLRLPVEFFLNGWVHALTDAEIAVYLFLLHLQQRNPTTDPDEGVAVDGDLWDEAFHTSRGYIGYRMLSRFGLIRVFRQDVRRDDGTIEGLTQGEEDFTHLPNEPMRFIVDLEVLHLDALGQVLPALALAADGTRLDAAWAASRGHDIS